MKLKFSNPILFLSLIFFYSCSKKENRIGESSMPPVPMGTIAFHIHAEVGNVEIDSGAVLINPDGTQRFQLDIAGFYLSDIIVYKGDGTAVPVQDAYILQTLGEDEYMVGQVPTGNYRNVSFNVGLNPSLNRSLPSEHSGVLASQPVSMWFGSKEQGYIFMNIKGKADTSAGHNGSLNKEFAYQLGGDAQLRNVVMPSLTESGLSYITVTSLNTPVLPAQFHMICDYGMLLKEIDFKTASPLATPFNGDSTTLKPLLKALPGIFKYEM